MKKQNNFKVRSKELYSKDTLDILWQGALGSAINVLTPSLVLKLSKGKAGNGVLGIGMGAVADALVYTLTGWKGVWYAGVVHTVGQFVWLGNEELLKTTYDAFPNSGLNDYIAPPVPQQYLGAGGYNYLPAPTTMNDYITENEMTANLNDYIENYNQSY